MGTACEHVVLPAQQAVALARPGGLRCRGLLWGFQRSPPSQAIHLAGPLQGKTVLVTGAGNAVGHCATQLAVLQGATVIGTAGAPARQQHARDAGAAARDRLPARIGGRSPWPGSPQGRGVDVVIDMDFASTAALLPHKVLKPHGQPGVLRLQPGRRGGGGLSARCCSNRSSSPSFWSTNSCPTDRARAVQTLDRAAAMPASCGWPWARPLRWTTPPPHTKRWKPGGWSATW